MRSMVVGVLAVGRAGLNGVMLSLQYCDVSNIRLGVAEFRGGSTWP